MDVLYSTETNRPDPRRILEEWINGYGNQVYRVCRSLTFSKEDADDLFQETFTRAFDHLRKGRIPENPQGFLFSTASYVWKTWKRKHARRNRLAPVEPLTETVTDGASLEDNLLEREEIRVLRGLVAGLPEKHRTPVLLHYTLEMSIPDIAAALNIPAGTVKSRLFKARGLLKKGLGKYGQH